jgi:hypothetical protein
VGARVYRFNVMTRAGAESIEARSGSPLAYAHSRDRQLGLFGPPAP